MNKTRIFLTFLSLSVLLSAFFMAVGGTGQGFWHDVSLAAYLALVFVTMASSNPRITFFRNAIPPARSPRSAWVDASL